MAEQKKKPRKKTAKKKKVPEPTPLTRLVRQARKWVLRGVLAVLVLTFVAVTAYSFINPPITPYMASERRMFGPLDRKWVAFDDIAPVMIRSAVAAEDANFCGHWGLDVRAIEAALAEGSARGGSTISQQTVKNVYLWHGRSWTRKALEALLTPLVELMWSKERILEVYLNVAEFDTGVFGVEAAAWHYFRVPASDLTREQAARLAVVLPNPKGRNAADLPNHLLRRMRSVADGAETIRRDGRASCFER